MKLHLLKRISTRFSFNPLPHLNKNGTPSHLRLRIFNTQDAKVGVVELSSTVGSSLYPICVSLAIYCPTTKSSFEGGLILRRTLTFSSRISLGFSVTGGSIVKRARICIIWFCITSLIIP